MPNHACYNVCCLTTTNPILFYRNGSSLDYLELSRSSLLRMDPLLFRNVLTSASRLHSLVVKNICSDAMLKLIGTHCHGLQYLDISRCAAVSRNVGWVT